MNSGLYALKPWYAGRLWPVRRWLVGAGISPHVVTATGIVFGAADEQQRDTEREDRHRLRPQGLARCPHWSPEDQNARGRDRQILGPPARQSLEEDGSPQAREQGRQSLDDEPGARLVDRKSRAQGGGQTRRLGHARPAVGDERDEQHRRESESGDHRRLGGRHPVLGEVGVRFGGAAGHCLPPRAGRTRR